MTTQLDFLTAYCKQLVNTYPWARDDAKLIPFLAAVSATLDGDDTWIHDGAATQAAWRDIGGKGKVTLAALRALPKGEVE